MRAEETNERILRLEQALHQLRHQFQSLLDNPQAELLPFLPRIVTTNKERVSLEIVDNTLLVYQKNRLVGSVTLQGEG